MADKQTMADMPTMYGNDRVQLMSHEEIVKSFLASRAVDFNALGQFVSTFGESIVISGRGDYGVRFGHYNILACFNNQGPTYINGIDVGRSGLAGEVLGR